MCRDQDISIEYNSSGLVYCNSDRALRLERWGRWGGGRERKRENERERGKGWGRDILNLSISLNIN